MSESRLPSGYESTQSLEHPLTIGPDVLPWLKEPYHLAVAECTLSSGETFYLASAIGSHPKLIQAAEAMTDDQRVNTDNMLYSRLPNLLSDGYHPHIEAYPSPATSFPIKTMRNNGGQRVYFSRLTHSQGPGDEPKPLILRLAACDKNKQGLIFSVLGNKSDRQMRRKTSK